LKKEEGKVEGLVWSNILPINISIQQTKKGENKKKKGEYLNLKPISLIEVGGLSFF
jgi:hypothetical protein